MNFDEIFCLSACLAKQLELRWFYEWKLKPVTSNDNDKNPDKKASDVDVDDNKIVSAKHQALEGRLVKKKIPSVPFLRRNIFRNDPLNNVIGCNVTPSVQISKRVKTKANFWSQFKRENVFPASVDVVSQLSFLSTHGGHENPDSKKRKRGRPPKSQAPVSKQKKSKICETHSVKGGALSSTCNKKETPTHRIEPFKRPPPPFSALELFHHSPHVRHMIVDEIPAELHHDAVFVDERIRKLWTEIQSIEKPNHGDAVGGNKSTSETSSLSFNDSSSNQPSKILERMMNNKGIIDTESCDPKLDDILSLSYWVRMEKEEYERFEKEMNEYQSAFNTTKDEEESKTSSAKEFVETSSSHSYKGRKKNCQSLHGFKCNSFSLRRTDVTRDKQQQRNKLSPAYFHYLYMDSKNTPSIIVQQLNRRVCPFCNHDGKNDEGLLLHCAIFHGVLARSHCDKLSLLNVKSNNNESSFADIADGPTFEAVRDEDGNLHVAVRGIPPRSSLFSDAKKDFSYQRNFIFLAPKFTNSNNRHKFPFRDGLSELIPFLQRSHSKAALMDPVLRRKKLLALQERDAPAEILCSYFPRDDSPIRQYFHSRNNLPISRAEWEIDSDDEPDDDWLHQMGSKLIEEFEDVSGKEKRFMNMWNVFIKSHCVIADRDIPGKCQEFIQKYKDQLINEGLRTNVLLHLFNLWDDGVMSSGNILVCMSLLEGGGVGV